MSDLHITDVNIAKANLDLVGKAKESGEKVIYYTDSQGKIGTIHPYNIVERFYRHIRGESNRERVETVLTETHRIGTQLFQASDRPTYSPQADALRDRYKAAYHALPDPSDNFQHLINRVSDCNNLVKLYRPDEEADNFVQAELKADEAIRKAKEFLEDVQEKAGERFGYDIHGAGGLPESYDADDYWGHPQDDVDLDKS